MKQIIQSYRSGELWLAEVAAPACKSGGVLVRTQVSFVSAGTERMLVDFAKKNLVGKAVAMPDQVKKVLRKVKSEGLFSTIEKVQASLAQRQEACLFSRVFTGLCSSIIPIPVKSMS